MRDEELVRRLQQGELRAFAPLYERYRELAVRTAFLLTYDQHAAEDLAHESFLRALQRVDGLREPSRFRSWFLVILTNLARRHSQKWWRWIPGLPEGRQLPDLAAPSPHEQARAREEVEQIRAALPRLTALHREVIVLRYYLDLGETEIAGILGIPPGTVKSRLHNARSRLAAILTEGGDRHAARG